MRATYLVLITWVLSTHANPIRSAEHQERRSHPSTLPLKDGQQLESPCPDLLDPKTGSIALYFYHGLTQEQRRATQFVNDHWGLPACCNTKLHTSCTSPPDPQPEGSPCPQLKDDNGNTLVLYGNPYTTDQIASNLVILDALSQELCFPNSGNDTKNTVSLSPSSSPKPQTGQVSPPDISSPLPASGDPSTHGNVSTLPDPKLTAPLRTSSPQVIDPGFADG